MSQYTISRNGVVLTIIEADDLKMDLTGDHPVAIFHKDSDAGQKEAEIDLLDTDDAIYANWQG